MRSSNGADSPDVRVSTIGDNVEMTVPSIGWAVMLTKSDALTLSRALAHAALGMKGNSWEWLNVTLAGSKIPSYILQLNNGRICGMIVFLDTMGWIGMIKSSPFSDWLRCGEAPSLAEAQTLVINALQKANGL